MSGDAPNPWTQKDLALRIELNDLIEGTIKGELSPQDVVELAERMIGILDREDMAGAAPRHDPDQRGAHSA